MAKPAPALVNHRRLAGLIGESPRRVRAWISQGHLKCHSQIANTYYFRREDVERYVRTGEWRSIG